MLPLEFDRSDDRDVVFRNRFDAIRREFLKTLVTPDVIEEHRRSPLGQHSEPLERLLLYFRARPPAGRFAIKVIEPFKRYRIIVLSGHRGVEPAFVDDTIHASVRDAYHGLFLQNIRDLLAA